MKEEIFQALKDLNLSTIHFDQRFEGHQFSNAKHSVQFETKNFWVDITLMETVKWERSGYENEFYDLEVTELQILDENENNFTDQFTDEEILNALNY